MINLDDEMVGQYLAESRNQLVTVGTDLLDMEVRGAAIDEEVINRIFRAVHSINGGAGFFGLVKIRELAHKMQGALARIRAREMAPTSERAGVLLSAADRLNQLIQDPANSNQADIAKIIAALAALPVGPVEDGISSHRLGTQAKRAGNLVARA